MAKWNFTTARELTLPGTRFSRWIVIGETFSDKKGNSRVLCRCECGTTRDVSCNLLVKGGSLSCGCYQRQVVSEICKVIRRTHGKTGSRVYGKWVSMLTRCYNPAEKCYPNYGGRGITVCDEWRDFKNFYTDMGDPGDGMSLDRIDPNGNYEPSNCRWLSMSAQARNKRNNRKLTVNGVTKISVEWAEETGIPCALINARIDRLGWSEEKAITTPVTKRAKR